MRVEVRAAYSQRAQLEELAPGLATTRSFRLTLVQLRGAVNMSAVCWFQRMSGVFASGREGYKCLLQPELRRESFLP